MSLLILGVSQAYGYSNPNLYVSAENSDGNYFTGSQVIEVIVNDPNIRNTDEGKGEPDVTINGKSLRMVQASNGQWYAYFANIEMAKKADALFAQPGAEGFGLDFGVFCSRSTETSVFGIDFSETDGIAVPRKGGISNYVNGDSSFSKCTGSPSSSENLNNVVRNANSINQNPSVLSGQIGLDPNAWPVIQLFSFDDVTIIYNRAGGMQKVNLNYDDIPNITLSLDRDSYPNSAEVFVTVSDFQLNQDPTDNDSWTFNIGPTSSTFYYAFDNNGGDAANQGPGLVNLVSHLGNLGFEKNGKISMNLGSVVELSTNDNQPKNSVTDGIASYNSIITLVESEPNSGVFESFDHNDKSTLKIKQDAPRGNTASVSYNGESHSILTGFTTGGIGLGKDVTFTIDPNQKILPGTEILLSLFDPDQNINSNSREHLDAFRENVIMPSLKIGDPFTLGDALSVKLYPSNSFTGGTSVQSSVPDKISDRLILKTTSANSLSFEMISLDLGINDSFLKSVLIPSSTNTIGTNWINYDLRSIQKDLELEDFSDTSLSLHFGILPDPTSVVIAEKGQVSSHGFIQIPQNKINEIYQKSGKVFLLINFDSSNDSSNVATISNEINNQPIIFDLFSFGIKDDKDINNAIYRFELEETSDNSSTFRGSFSYAVVNQLNIMDSSFIKSLRTISDEIKFLVTDRMIDEQGLTITYSDITSVGVQTPTSYKSDILTHSGTVSTDSNSYRFGQPVKIILNDPDLNVNDKMIDVYNVIDNPASENVDTVGGNSGEILLEVKIKDIRFKRCTINGKEFGGLAATGFTLVETKVDSGLFEGLFKMPSQICDQTGTKLISPAGGSIDVKYYDYRDASGEFNIFGLSTRQYSSSVTTDPIFSNSKINLPPIGKTEEIILSGEIKGHSRGLPLVVKIIGPDGSSKIFSSLVNSNGSYRSIITLNHNSLVGTYLFELSYMDRLIASTQFEIIQNKIPMEIQQNAKLWASNVISDNQFAKSLGGLVDQGIIPDTQNFENQTIQIPSWLKKTVKWWSENKITENDLLNTISFLVKKGIILV